MAQHRTRESDTGRGPDAGGHDAALLRLGRIARDGLGRAANDNRARIWHRAGGVIVIAAAVAVIGYAVLRWVV